MLPFGAQGYLPPGFGGTTPVSQLPQQLPIPINVNADIQTIPIPNSNSEWSEHKSTDGKIYYYNRIKKISSWSKPDELKTPEELERAQWKEYKTPEGKSYYYNMKTKATTWNKPEILQKEEMNELPEPVLVHISSESELEKAMEATLKNYETKPKQEKDDNKAKEEEIKKQSSKKTVEDAEYELRKRQVERFQDLLRDKCIERKISISMSWEQVLKYIQHDPRFKILTKMSERKQVFNAWKIQRSKEERDERRLAIKKSKEDLEKWLLNNEKVKPSLRYYKADEMFITEPLWRAVSSDERKEIFLDVIKAVTKREEENKKVLKERNIKVLADILESIHQIDHKTTWAEAQVFLVNNSGFSSDSVLQGMDKEDALIVFQQHIRQAEEHYQKEKQGDIKRIKRQERKIRDEFMQLLHELHRRENITPFSTWSELFPVISADERFEKMLAQSGSTALDLFKFYVEDLKTVYSEARHTIKHIIKDQNIALSTMTSFDHFQKLIKTDDRAKNIDVVDLKLCFKSVVDKIIEKEKDAEKDTVLKYKKIEATFWDLLRDIEPPIDPTTRWDDVRGYISEDSRFKAVETEEDREQFFENYLKSISEACGHHHSSKKKKEKKKKRHRDIDDEKTKNDDDKGRKRKKKKAELERSHSSVSQSPSSDY